jgi:four helix bundle protein
LNIAEGAGRRTPDDQRKFYSIALGSLRECQAIFDIEEIKTKPLIESADRLGALLFKLSRKRNG